MRIPTRPPRQQPLLARQAIRQKAEAARVVAGVEKQIRTAYAAAQQAVWPTIAAFEAAYAAEIARLEALRDEGDETPVRVPVHWLQTSGWLARLKNELGSAKQTANHVGRRATIQGYHQLADMGEQHAKDLLTSAMRPAVKAGMRWRPK